MKDKETPLRLIRLWQKLIPGCYEYLDSKAAENGLNGVPSWCPLPISHAFSCIVNAGNTTEDAAATCAELLACWAWRKNKIIYHFDPDLARMLADQADGSAPEDVLPADLLFNLPYPIFYVKCPGIVEDTDGFFFWLEYDLQRKEAEIRVTWILQDMESAFSAVLHLIPGGTLRDCYIATANESAKYEAQPTLVKNDAERMEAMRPIMQAIQIALYLCAENAEVVQSPRPVSVAPQKKQKIILDKASEIDEYNVGVRIGSVIRRAAARKTAETKDGAAGTKHRPHSRRGHWHHYWTGPRDGDRTLTLKWVAPTFIHADDVASEAAVIVSYPVK